MISSSIKFTLGSTRTVLIHGLATLNIRARASLSPWTRITEQEAFQRFRWAKIAPLSRPSGGWTPEFGTRRKFASLCPGVLWGVRSAEWQIRFDGGLRKPTRPWMSGWSRRAAPPCGLGREDY
jgi:hypothetical protein